MAGDVPVASGTLERSLLRPMHSLDVGKTSVQEERSSNRTPVSQTLSSSATETVATYIANIWRPTANPVPQVAIVTKTPQIIATQQKKTSLFRSKNPSRKLPAPDPGSLTICSHSHNIP
ncbi:unnamed protein product [Lactuca saligna]|uniref:Uncharacterized protein n=1 Tax=Lactuca saligna TaxID=75948 RepID=A0AA36E8Y1_LACSI|nr:unnamed protein product [Lactuca saligna]